MSDNWKETITNTNWMNEIRCPYCKHRYVRSAQLSSKPNLYWWVCGECGMRESWLEEYNLYTTYEEGLDVR